MTVAQGTDMAYDADGRKLKDTLTGGGSSHAVTQYSYDAEGRLTCAAQRMDPADWGALPASACTLTTPAGSFGPDRSTKNIRDANGRVTTVQVAVGVVGQEANERTLAYSANGVLTHLIDANNNRTTYEVDGHDRLVKTRFPLPAIGSNSSSTTDYEQLTLDPNSNVTTRRLRDGQNIGYTYDALNRLTAKDLPAAEPDATYAYDLANRMTSATQNSITNNLTWDALDRKLTESAPQGTVTSEYDLASRRTKVTLPGATSLFANYEYDVLGNTTFIRENGAASGVGVLATYQYDSLSRRSSVTFGNGAVQNYTFDPVTRLATQITNLAATANDLTQTFAYNPASQISSVTRSNDLYAWTGHFNQNDGSTANGLNQIANAGAKTVTHDTKGNITAVGTDAYTYSSENQLKTGPGSAALSYDPMGRLYQVTQGAGTTRLGYDGLDRIAEYDAANAAQRRYIHGPGIDNPITWYEGSGTTTRRFLSSDERGSVIAVTDSAGTVLGLNKYDEYGVPQSTNLGKFGYTGQTWLPEVSLWHYKARAYRPDIGRFMQTDRIGYRAGMNMCVYVGNDPVNWSDPLGLQAEDDEEIVVTGTRSGGGGVAGQPSYSHMRHRDPHEGPPECAQAGDVFPTEEDALENGARRAQAMQQKEGDTYERGGTARPVPGGFTFTDPIHNFATDFVNVSVRPGDVGWYHTHSLFESGLTLSFAEYGSRPKDIDQLRGAAKAAGVPVSNFISVLGTTTISGTSGDVFSWRGVPPPRSRGTKLTARECIIGD